MSVPAALGAVSLLTAIAPFGSPDPAQAAPTQLWNGIAAVTTDGELIVFDAVGAVSDGVDLGFVPPSDYALFAGHDGSRFVLNDLSRQPDNAAVLVDVAAGSVDRFDLPTAFVASPVPGSSSVVVAAAHYPAEAAIVIDIARGQALDLTALAPPDIELYFSSRGTRASPDGAFVAVNDGRLGTLIVSVERSTVVGVPGEPVNVTESGVVTALSSVTGTHVLSYSHAGVARGAVEIPRSHAFAVAADDSVVAVTETGELLRIDAEGRTVSALGSVALPPLQNPAVTTAFDGERIAVAWPGTIELLALDGQPAGGPIVRDGAEPTLITTGAMRCAWFERDLFPVTVDLTTRAQIEVPGDYVTHSSADGCTFWVEHDGGGQLVRDGAATEVPLDTKVLAISPDGGDAIVRIGTAFRLVETVDPLGDGVDLGVEAIAAMFI
jgi:hypothetical protein